MGRAKTMNAIGVCDLYSHNYYQFFKKIGQIFKANFNVVYFDNIMADKTNYIEKENEIFNFNFQDTYNVLIYEENYDESTLLPENNYGIYELKIPVNLKHENELWLSFFPNGLFHLEFLPFSGLWRFFVEDLIGINDHYYNSHEEIVADILKIRSCYTKIIKRLGCSQVIIWTDGDYNSETKLFENFKPNKHFVFSDIIETMQKLDNLTILPFMDAVNQKINITTKYGNFTDIAFIDKF